MIKVVSAEAFEGPAHHYRGMEHPVESVLLPVVVALAEDGRQYVHTGQSVELVYDEEGFGPYPRLAYDLERARRLASQVRHRGEIDPKLWDEWTTPSTEERAQEDWILEQEQRMGLRPEGGPLGSL